MEVTKISQKIEECIGRLRSMQKEIKMRSEKRAEANSNYDKQLAITLVKLANNRPIEFEGEVLENVKTTVAEKIAKGICWESKLEMDKSDANYKSLITNIEAEKSILNGYQSINRHLDS